MKSIRTTLLLWLTGGLSLGIIAAACFLYFQAREEANQLFDYQMKQMAAAVPSRFFGPASPGHDEFPSAGNIIIQIWDASGLRIYYSHEYRYLPQRTDLGFSNITALGESWRVYAVRKGNAIVQIAQPIRVRRSLAAESAIKTVAPLLLLIPFLGSLAWIAVSRGLQPVRRVAAEVQTRDAATLAPVSGAGLPQEILPLTHALNDLLSRLDRAIDAQRTFVADAAHELRTPLTALSLQVQLVERAASEEERQAAISDLRMGLDRATRLVQQLLTLARQEPSGGQTSQAVDLADIARSAVAELALAADARRIDLGIKQLDSGKVRGDPDAIHIILSNLLENAIRYTPEGGRIDVSVHADAAAVTLAVQDTGKGIPESEMERVFDRFYRGAEVQSTGSGLGLAIVKRIAELHHAEVSLANTSEGLRATVRFARAA